MSTTIKTGFHFCYDGYRLAAISAGDVLPDDDQAAAHARAHGFAEAKDAGASPENKVMRAPGNKRKARK